MGDLSVTVRLNGQIVEEQVLRVNRVVRIGEGAGSAVSFPGADVAVVRMGDRLAVRGRSLEEGEEVHISLGPVEVAVEHTLRARLPHEWVGLWDGRFFAAALLVTAVGTWFDAAEMWLDRLPRDTPVAVSQLHNLLSGGPSTALRQRAAAMHPTPDPARGSAQAEAPAMTDGPRHRPDESSESLGWWAWYRNEVPRDDQEIEALERLTQVPDDASARRLLARSAYDKDDYDLASWHFRWILQRYPGDRDARLRLARSERRRGNHRVEAEIYRALLDEDPDNLLALSGLATALARLNRLDEALVLLDELQAVAPMSPLTELTVARVEALQGHDKSAIEALDRAFASREQLSQELQLELRRDLALDPAFSSLRKDRRLRGLVHRHLGAAGPRPAR